MAKGAANKTAEQGTLLKSRMEAVLARASSLGIGPTTQKQDGRVAGNELP